MPIFRPRFPYENLLEKSRIAGALFTQIPVNVTANAVVSTSASSKIAVSTPLTASAVLTARSFVAVGLQAGVVSTASSSVSASLSSVHFAVISAKANLTSSAVNKGGLSAGVSAVSSFTISAVNKGGTTFGLVVPATLTTNVINGPLTLGIIENLNLGPITPTFTTSSPVFVLAGVSGIAKPKFLASAFATSAYDFRWDSPVWVQFTPQPVTWLGRSSIAVNVQLPQFTIKTILE